MVGPISFQRVTPASLPSEVIGRERDTAVSVLCSRSTISNEDVQTYKTMCNSARTHMARQHYTLIRRPLCFFSVMTRIHTRLIRCRGTSTIQIRIPQSLMLKSCLLTSRLRSHLHPRMALFSLVVTINMLFQILTLVTLLQLRGS